MSGLPVLHVEGDGIARTWENSLIALYNKGGSIRTEYDSPDDSPSKDATMVLTIHFMLFTLKMIRLRAKSVCFFYLNP